MSPQPAHKSNGETHWKKNLEKELRLYQQVFITMVGLSKFVQQTCIMLTAIKGIYNNGKIILTEEPPVTTKSDVIVTFLTDEAKKQKGLNQPAKSKKKQRKLGGLKGKVNIPDDFNEPLDDLREYMY